MIDRYDAVILAGGRGSRLGAPSKPDLRVGGRRLLDIALAAAGGADRIVVVGDIEVPDGVLRTREEPAYGGPVAGLEAGLASLDDPADWTLLLASDLPDAEAAVGRLLAASPAPEHDGACLLDADGRFQWLLGCYRNSALRARLADRGDPPLTALYRLLGPLHLLGVEPGSASVDDLDTPADAQRWTTILAAEERP
ncbi:MAG TPA: NTP transferase domain-containing protein [Propionicimonas sp.]|uniref:molybdenum cofactor guanylyltransferase n=1 Tax=Propionicimonas sp. TaxID=1955623 RepID=UPI002F403293